ncbi:MAG: RagB/SusD family nutrient uptake outer membrane protein, partial [Flammeovirgaceae bacterium]
IKFSLPLALQTDPTDKRIAFFYNTTSALPGSTRNNLARASFFTANNASVPIYRPGEMMLIKAEANVRKANQDLTAAVAELNNVLTKTTDALGIGAGLTAYSGANTAEAILVEIYRQRCIELYLSGLRFEDSRRFGR